MEARIMKLLTALEGKKKKEMGPEEEMSKGMDDMDSYEDDMESEEEMESPEKEMMDAKEKEGPFKKRGIQIFIDFMKKKK